MDTIPITDIRSLRALTVRFGKNLEGYARSAQVIDIELQLLV